MTQIQPTIEQVQSELAARIARIGAGTPRRRPDDIAIEIDAIRRIAHRHGLYPAVAVAQTLGTALARGEHGALIEGWLSILRDAIGCDRRDRDACEIFAAACSVRLAT